MNSHALNTPHAGCLLIHEGHAYLVTESYFYQQRIGGVGYRMTRRFVTPDAPEGQLYLSESQWAKARLVQPQAIAA